MDSHLFRPAIDSKGFFSVNGSDILGNGNISFGLVLDYGHNILRTRDNGTPIDPATGMACAAKHLHRHRDRRHGSESARRQLVQGTFGISYGIANKAIVGITISVNLMAGTRRTTSVERRPVQLRQARLAEAQLPRVHGKLRLTRVDRGIGLAIVAQAGIPLTDAPKDLGPIRKPGTGRSSWSKTNSARHVASTSGSTSATARTAAKIPSSKTTSPANPSSPKARSSTQTSARTASASPTACWIRWI